MKSKQTCNDGINVLQFSMAMNISYANTLTFHMDSGLKGFGVMIESDQLGGFSSSVPEFSCQTCSDVSKIYYLELFPVHVGLLRLAPSCRDHHLLCYTDNTQVLCMINKGTSVNSHSMELLREIFWDSDIDLTAKHIRGSSNVIADYLSRLSSNTSLSNFPASLFCSAGVGSP